MPYFEADLQQIHWVPSPAEGSERVFNLLLTDARTDLPKPEVPEGESVIAALEMANGWHMTLHTAERPLQDAQLPVIEQQLDEMRIGMDGMPQRGSTDASMVWITTSLERRPLFVQMVLNSDNFFLRETCGRE